MSTVRIISDGTPRNSRVEVDGVELKDVTGVSFDLDAGKPAGEAVITVALFDLELTLEDWVITKPETTESEADHG